MSTTPDYASSSRDPSDLERKGDAIRADMDRTLGELEDRLSPSQLMDRSIGYLREHGSDFVHEVGETVRRNPVPVLLTAAGLIWLTTSLASRARAAASDAHSDDDDDYGYSSVAGFDDSALDTEGSSSATRAIRSRAAAAKDRARSAMHTARNRVAGSMHTVGDSVRARTDRARSNFTHLVDEQPLALGALAVAAGALLGAALPITASENRVLGPVRDRTLEKAKAVGEDQYEKLREAVASSTSTGAASGNGGSANQTRTRPM